MPPSTVTLERVRLPSRVKYHTAVMIIATTLNTSTPQNTCLIKTTVPGSRYFFGFCFRDGSFMCVYKDGADVIAALLFFFLFCWCFFVGRKEGGGVVPPPSYFLYPIFSLPIYGRRTSGIRIDPSACWKFSTKDTRIRGAATAVLFRE